MHRRWGALATVAALVAALVGVTGHEAAANPYDDKRRVDAQLAQAGTTLEGATARAQQATQLYAAANAQLPGAQQRAAQARGVAAAAQARADQAGRDAQVAQASYTASSDNLRAAGDAVEAARGHAAQFADAAFRGGGLVALNAVLAARSPTDLADRLGYLDQVARSSTQALTALTGARLAAKYQQNDAAVKKQAADNAKAAADGALVTAKQSQAAAEAAEAAVRALIAQRQQGAAVAEQERAQSLAQYQALQAESNRIAEQLRIIAEQERAAAAARARAAAAAQARAAAQAQAQPYAAANTGQYTGGYFPMPVHGAYKSSDFGWRYDPYYHVWQLHAGVDLAVPSGTPIYAVAAGTVIRAGWDGGYGNYTCISHGLYDGQGIATCYGHQSEIDVSPGDYVSAGQFIGRVGTTGASTGPHLHFEVRLDGTPVNPLGFLPSCLCP